MNNRRDKIVLCSQTNCKRGELCPNYAPIRNRGKRHSYIDCMWFPTFDNSKRVVKSES